MEENNVSAQSTRKRGVVQFLYALLLVIPALFFWGILFVLFAGFSTLFFTEVNSCNVARIPLQGILTSTDTGLSEMLGYGFSVSADSITEQITSAEEDDDMVAILLDVDSPGGTPLAGDEIMQALKDAQKPVVAVVRDRGASAAYWAIAGADYIFASPVSDVGSIGVTMSYLELASTTDNVGSRWIDLSSGAYKDAGNPERVLREEEKEHFQSQVNTVHEYMILRIADSRKQLSREELSVLADGRAFLGKEALELKLIDELGGFTEAYVYLQKVLSMSDTEVLLCEPKTGQFGGLL